MVDNFFHYPGHRSFVAVLIGVDVAPNGNIVTLESRHHPVLEFKPDGSL
ncbi:MAG: hypothetical protein U0Q11_26395 [Vicinamibacterales bacterium]